MKHSYPIKYAVMPIETRNCRDGIPYTIYNIISKCYVLEDRTIYTECGESKKEYRVCFPFQNDCGVIFNKIYPDKHDAITIDKVFDTYDEALEEKEKCNTETLDYGYFSFDDFKDFKKTREEKKTYFCELEKLIEDNTPELDASIIPRKHITVEIKSDNSGYYSLSDSFYFNLYRMADRRWNKETSFIVYSLSDDECKKLINQFDNKNMDLTNFIHTPLFLGTGGNNIVKLISPTGDKCDLVIDRDSCWLSREEPIEEPQKFDMIVFTNETYIDVLNSFNLNPQINSTIELGYQRQMWSLHKL